MNCDFTGPIENNIEDFWRMIWEKDVYTIVMATRTVEETKVCFKVVGEHRFESYI